MKQRQQQQQQQLQQQQQKQSPSWLFSLTSEKFFTTCRLHQSSKKCERNIFCLDCCTSICPQCLSLHHSHCLLQVRRYVYHDVIRLDDMDKLFDCSYVQSYITNSAKVIFLNQRPRSHPFKGSANLCYTCHRSLQRLYHFCSLACKVEYLVRYEGCISRYTYECEYLSLQMEEEEELPDGQMTPSSILDGAISLRTSSGSSNNSDGVLRRTLWCTATTENVTRKKRTSKSTVFSSNDPRRPSKRKGLPLRSPLY